MPLGGSCRFEYAKVGNTVELPQSHYVMSSLTKDDGVGSFATDRGIRSYCQEFEYSNGHYDRKNRVFLGFGKVTTSVSATSWTAAERQDPPVAVKSVATTSYYTDYSRRGMQRGSELETAAAVSTAKPIA